MSKLVYIGIHADLLKVIPNQYHDICVIDQTNETPTTTFESEKVQALYQASLISGQVKHESFEDSFDFYDHIITQQFEILYEAKKKILEFLNEHHIRVIKGRITQISDQQIEVSYLNQKSVIDYDEIHYLNGKPEHNITQSPFVFSFDQFLNTNQLFKKIAVVGKSLRAIEIASLFKRFGSDVSLVVGRKYFSQINHLEFRDAIRASLSQQGIHVFEKYVVDEMQDEVDGVTLKLQPESALAFEIGEQLTRQDSKFDAVIMEFNTEKTYNPSILYSQPVLATFNPEAPGEIKQFDSDEFTYFNSRFETEGGIEYRISNGKILGATFYCSNAVDLKQIMTLIKDKSLFELAEMDVIYNSQLGVLKESAQKILKG